MNINDILRAENVSSNRGAPMGRSDITENPGASVHVQRVYFEDGDYDYGGAYWGGSSPLFCAFSDAGDFRVFIRADTRPDALRQVREDFPDSTILPDESDNSAFDIPAMLVGYLECALWSSTDDDGNPLDAEYFETDISEESQASARVDCQSFVDQCTESRIDLMSIDGMGCSRIGHDLWLTRNHHGAGFWDRGLGPIGARLTELAHAMGSVDAYIGDDDKVYFS